MTGPKNATSFTAMTGVPTSWPTRPMPSKWLARICGSNSSLRECSANSGGVGRFPLDPENWRNYARWKAEGGEPPVVRPARERE